MAQKKKNEGEFPKQSSVKRGSAQSAVSKSGAGSAAFNIWLERGLHQLFDDVAQEPVPEELLKLIEQDRKA